MTVLPPAQAVFNITELLENILLHLHDDPQTLLHTQRVSKTFKATFDGSVKLHEGLFLRRRPSKFAAPDPEINGLIANFALQKNIGIRRLKVEFNPSMKRLEVDIVFKSIEELQTLSKSEGSWRSMMVVQPLKKREDRWTLGYQFNDNWTKSVGEGGWYDGLWLGQLVEIVLERWEEQVEDPWEVLKDRL